MTRGTFLAVVVVAVIGINARVGICGFLPDTISTYCAYQTFLMYNPADDESNSLHWGTDVNTTIGEVVTFPFSSGSYVVLEGQSGEGYNVFCTPGASTAGRNNYIIFAHVWPATGFVLNQSTSATEGATLGTAYGINGDGHVHAEVYSGVAVPGGYPGPAVALYARGFYNPEDSILQGIGHGGGGSDGVYLLNHRPVFELMDPMNLRAWVCAASTTCTMRNGVRSLDVTITQKDNGSSFSGTTVLDCGSRVSDGATISWSRLYNPTQPEFQPVDIKYFQFAVIIPVGGFSYSGDLNTYITDNYVVSASASLGSATASGGPWNPPQADETPPRMLPEVDIVPNPANPTFRVEIAGFDEDVKVDLFDLSGRRVAADVSVVPTATGSCGIPADSDLRRMPSGAYMVRVADSKRVQTQKLLLLK
jgi:hypothetical protein